MKSKTLFRRPSPRHNVYFVPYPSETVLSGISEHERWQFDHDELFVGAYQAKPAKLALEDYPYDEFIYLLSGKIDITDKDGNLQSFFPGQALVLKKVLQELLK